MNNKALIRNQSLIGVYIDRGELIDIYSLGYGLLE